MSFLATLRVEAGRLFRGKTPLLLMLLTILSPAAGIWFYRPMYAESPAYSLNGAYIGNLALAGALVGAVAFAVLTAFEMDRAHRSKVDALTDSMTSALSSSLAQTLSVILAAVTVMAVTILLWLPYAMIHTGSVFNIRTYILCYLVVMLPAMLISVLFTAAAYQITKRLDLSLVLFLAFTMLSMFLWNDNWLLRWINPALHYLSDDFGNLRRLQSIAWNRLFWLALVGGVWALSFLCVRRYGKNILGSIRHNLRKAYLPFIAGLMILCSVFTYSGQPFLDHGSPDASGFEHLNSGQNDSLLLKSSHIDARPNVSNGTHRGTANFGLLNTSGQPQTLTIFINAGYTLSSASANGSPAAWRDLDNDSRASKTIEVDLPADSEIHLVLEFGGRPAEDNAYSLMQGQAEISRDYVQLLNAELGPVTVGISVADKATMTYTADISLPEGLVPVLYSQGKSQMIGRSSDNTVRWRLEDTVAFMHVYAGDYISHRIDTGDIEVEFFYSAKHKRVMEECNVDEVIKQVFAYCTKHYGPLSFYGDNSLKLIETGLVGGGYAGFGSSVIPEDSFNEEGLKNPTKGASGAEVLAHEIIHQWWGLGCMFHDQPDGVWSAEGLTVYTTYRMMKEQYGAQYAKKHYIDVWQAAVDDYYQNFYVRNPEYMDRLPEQYREEINSSIRSTRHYSEMALKILKAEELVGGEEKMDEILQQLFSSGSYGLSYEAFLDACGLTEEDLVLV